MPIKTREKGFRLNQEKLENQLLQAVVEMHLDQIKQAINPEAASRKGIALL
jgi:hypothetical protein